MEMRYIAFHCGGHQANAARRCGAAFLLLVSFIFAFVPLPLVTQFFASFPSASAASNSCLLACLGEPGSLGHIREHYLASSPSSPFSFPVPSAPFVRILRLVKQVKKRNHARLYTSPKCRQVARHRCSSQRVACLRLHLSCSQNSNQNMIRLETCAHRLQFTLSSSSSSSSSSSNPCRWVRTCERRVGPRQSESRFPDVHRFRMGRHKWIRSIAAGVSTGLGVTHLGILHKASRTRSRGRSACLFGPAQAAAGVQNSSQDAWTKKQK
jgi:hypothetical protein